MEKVRFGGLEMLKPNAIEPTKMPRTAMIAVVRDGQSGDLNAAPYSGGVVNLNPLQILFGVKGRHAIEAFRQAEEFCVALPNKNQIDAVWTMALEVPHGINEMDIAGWQPLASRFISTPGIEECALNLECRKIAYIKLPSPWRAIIIGEVVGLSMDRTLLGMNRSDVANLLPIHEAGSHPATGLYSPSFLTAELFPPADPFSVSVLSNDRLTINTADLFLPEYDHVLAKAIFPRPTYILMTANMDGSTDAQVISGGSLQSNEPSVQIPLKKNSRAYYNIQRTGEFAVSIPDFAHLQNLEQFERQPEDFAPAGFSLLPHNRVKVQGIEQCPVTMDCKCVILEDVPGMDYALLVGRKVGVTLDEEIATRLDPDQYPLEQRLNFINKLYSRYIYAVMDRGQMRKWGHQDPNPLSVPPLPSWGSRYTGGWWGPGPALDFWLIELCQEGLLSKPDYFKIIHALHVWNDGKGIAHLVEFYTPEMKEELRKRLTHLFHQMAWAHRDLERWRQVHQILSTFENPPRDHHSGPTEHENWIDRSGISISTQKEVL